MNKFSQSKNKSDFFLWLSNQSVFEIEFRFCEIKHKKSKIIFYTEKNPNQCKFVDNFSFVIMFKNGIIFYMEFEGLTNNLRELTLKKIY